MKKKTIVLTGGGTAGHVSLNQAIIPTLEKQSFEVHYIGSKDGIELELIRDAFPHIKYHAISSGKLRRYASVKNFTDPLRVMKGLLEALLILKKVKPSVIFSKGGFVSVPVVMAGKMAKIPVVIHESDVTPGLANKIAMPFAHHIFTVFPETLKHLPSEKSSCSGSIIRSELFEGRKEAGMRLCGFEGFKPVLLIMGGSQGSVVVNEAIRSNLPRLLEKYDVIHLCGKGKVDETLKNMKGYQQFEYVTHELPDLLHAANIIVSRAGSNSIFEFLALRKPMLLIPLSKQQSRGDQLLNAQIFKKQGWASVIEEEDVTPATFMAALDDVKSRAEHIQEVMGSSELPKTPDEMVTLITSYAK
ncbi:undecaprenyldiphospho-muramoylpentapeptide beta-N-acetylglucosaminyltransferase [Paenisporosarcina quisquiliarum]|uniref:UDP-N-acetylglucosamine--N-acetylmuramyl-(pentapeptide) pyrophosphoryl-undecaprenol N-acetylglucosamine transferase n=1 Tax=Paenisporosarcina quisquiliarum TaxID=365346 RepID=A0A9X3RC43_9BACL|nr:undecaprenyldiphospho-muramoylpentapeptide beta-N-acetylglucosaminyltransferase [Paenisporosarcina quisquiliarum]MCZ8535874.1 undecaprenyldiphospho-muramoylpentapeptide beta-N-acetylglucosaminyltransferase [Paenisporosarcina quisquiliarum]